MAVSAVLIADHSATGHGVPRIHDQVEDRRVELRRIDEAFGKVVRELEDDANSWTRAVFEELPELGEQGVHIFGASHELLLPCEGEKPVGHLHAALNAVADRSKRGLDLVRISGISLRDIQSAGDHAQHVAKIVRDPAGHFSKGADLPGGGPAAPACRHPVRYLLKVGADRNNHARFATLGRIGGGNEWHRQGSPLEPTG